MGKHNDLGLVYR